MDYRQRQNTGTTEPILWITFWEPQRGGLSIPQTFALPRINNEAAGFTSGLLRRNEPLNFWIIFGFLFFFLLFICGSNKLEIQRKLEQQTSEIFQSRYELEQIMRHYILSQSGNNWKQESASQTQSKSQFWRNNLLLKEAQHARDGLAHRVFQLRNQEKKG